MYWSIFNTFYNDEKIPLIPPLLKENKFGTDIKMKAYSIIFLLSSVRP